MSESTQQFYHWYLKIVTWKHFYYWQRMFLLPEKTVRLHMGFRGVGELYWIGDITEGMYHIRKLSVKMFATYSISNQVRIPDYRHRTWFQTRNFLCSTLSSVNYLCLCSAIDWGIPRVRLYPAILTRFTLEWALSPNYGGPKSVPLWAKIVKIAP